MMYDVSDRPRTFRRLLLVAGILANEKCGAEPLEDGNIVRFGQSYILYLIRGGLTSEAECPD